MLGNEVEMTQHGNPTVSTPLTRRTAPPPNTTSPGQAPIQLRKGGVPNRGWPGTAMLLREHPHFVLRASW